MKVRLIAHTPEPERLIAAAARLCYSDRLVSDLMSSLHSDEVARLVRMLKRTGHLSPLEHVSFTFSVEGLSRAALAQFTRHRMASFSVQSQRHIKSTHAGWIVPPAIDGDEAARHEFERLVQASADSYDRLLAMGIKREDARFCLPQAAPTSLIVTMNARELLWVARLRMCHTSQWEVRRVVAHMARLARAAAPVLLERIGPPCRQEGRCSEHSPCALLSRLTRFRNRMKEGTASGNTD